MITTIYFFFAVFICLVFLLTGPNGHAGRQPGCSLCKPEGAVIKGILGLFNETLNFEL